MNDRVLVTVRCRARRHVLARLVARSSDGHRVLEVPRWAVGDVAPGGGRAVVSNKYGGGLVDLDDEADEYRTDTRHVACACGSDFTLHPSHVLPSPRMEVRDGIRYRAEGETVPPPSLILLDPTRRV